MGISLSLPPVERLLVGGKEFGDMDPGGRASSRKLHWLPAIQPKGEGWLSMVQAHAWWVALLSVTSQSVTIVWPQCTHRLQLLGSQLCEFFFKGEKLFYKFGFKVRLVDTLIASFSNLHNLNGHERLVFWLILVSFIRKQNCVFPQLFIRSV